MTHGRVMLPLTEPQASSYVMQIASTANPRYATESVPIHILLLLLLRLIVPWRVVGTYDCIAWVGFSLYKSFPCPGFAAQRTRYR